MKKILLLSLPLLLSARIEWLNSYTEAIKKAQTANRPILVFIESEYCSWCKKMKREVFTKTEIQRIINGNFIPLKLDKDRSSYPKELSVKLVPTTIFLTPEGKKFTRSVLGYWEPKSYGSFLSDAIRRYKKFSSKVQ